jgi:hypothetical protein
MIVGDLGDRWKDAVGNRMRVGELSITESRD